MMDDHDDDDSRGSVGLLSHSEFDYGNVTEREDDLEEKYNAAAENSSPEIDGTVSSDDELKCKLVIPQSLPVVESMKLGPSLKKITKRKTTAGGKNVSIVKARKSDNTAQTGTVGLFAKKRARIVSKKLSAVEFAKKSSAAKKKPAPKSDAAAVVDESRKKPKAVKKSCKLVAMAAEEQPPVKKGRQDPKHQPEGVSSPPVTKDGIATSFSIETQVQTIPQVNTTRKNNKISSDTSTKSFSALHNNISDRRFWTETLAGDFASLGYNALLKHSQFTEQQVNALQHSFYQLSRKLSYILTYSDRLMKTHKCIECDFSTSHQCVSVDFTQHVLASANVTGVTNILPQSTIMCVCQFGFFHSHPTQPHAKLANNLNLKSSSHMLELNRSVSMCCPRCYMNVVMKNRNNEPCSDFENWNTLEDTNRRQFFKSLEYRLQASKIQSPYFNELYTCNRQCCQLFHRCGENSLSDNTMRPY